MEIEVKFSIGYVQLTDYIVMDDDATDGETEKAVSGHVMEKLDWSWKRVTE
jgi:hypothetical protein